MRKPILILSICLFAFASQGQLQMFLKNPVGSEPAFNWADVTGIVHGYSLRLLNTDYTGPLVRVRRVSDDSYHDIDSDGNGLIDTIEIASIGGGSSLIITKWYDQIGGVDLRTSDSVSATYYLIYDSGSLVKSNNKIAFYNPGTSVYFLGFTPLITQPLTLITTHQYDNSSDPSDVDIFDNAGGGATSRILLDAVSSSGNNKYRMFAGSSAISNSVISDDHAVLYTEFNNASSIFQLNDDTPETLPAGANSGWAGGIRLGSTGAAYYYGYFQELIIFNTSKDSERTTLMDNVISFWHN